LLSLTTLSQLHKL